MSTYERVADLALRIEDYALEGLVQMVSSDFERKSTVIRLRGAGEEGVGEDVVYEAVDHELAQEAGPALPLAGEWTVRSFAEHLATLELFVQPPQREVSQLYRTWAYESAALDLALRQAGRSLAGAVGREPRPITFVVSSRMGEPPTLGPVTRRLARYPELCFKLDATPDWDDSLIAAVVESGAVDSIDFKGAYKGTVVDVETDPAFYRRIAEAFPDAWLEDPDLESDEARSALAPHNDRITWDAPIHSVDDILALEWEPRTVNIKPSRVGSLAELGRAYDFCAERGIGAYGGGQTELDVGRDHIQYLAALFHPDTPNDVAPRGFNSPQPPDGMPESPIELEPARTGFRLA